MQTRRRFDHSKSITAVRHLAARALRGFGLRRRAGRGRAAARRRSPQSLTWPGSMPGHWNLH